MTNQLQRHKEAVIGTLSRSQYGVKLLQFYGRSKQKLKTSVIKKHRKSRPVLPKQNHVLTTYAPNTRLHDSLWTILIHFFQEFRRTRWQIWVTFKRDFVSSYNQTALGFLWSIVMPLIPVTVYLLLAAIRVLATTEDMPFVIYIVVGMTIWTFLSGTITSSVNSIQLGKSILESSRYPVFAVIMSNFGQMVYELLVRSTFVVTVLLFFRVSVSWTVLLLPLVLIPLVMFSLGAGMILAVLNIILKDINNIVNLVLRYGIFLSSVIFPMTETGVLGYLNKFNPFNTFVVTVRDFIVFGQITAWELYLVTSVMSFIVFLLACKILYFMEFRIKGYL